MGVTVEVPMSARFGIGGREGVNVPLSMADRRRWERDELPGGGDTHSAVPVPLSFHTPPVSKQHHLIRASISSSLPACPGLYFLRQSSNAMTSHAPSLGSAAATAEYWSVLATSVNAVPRSIAAYLTPFSLGLVDAIIVDSSRASVRENAPSSRGASVIAQKPGCLPAGEGFAIGQASKWLAARSRQPGQT
jgi:hypothetical protein